MMNEQWSFWQALAFAAVMALIAGPMLYGMWIQP